MVRRSAKEFKRLTGEKASFDESKPIKLLSFLRTVQKTLEDCGFAEGLAARVLYYLFGGKCRTSTRHDSRREPIPQGV